MNKLITFAAAIVMLIIGCSKENITNETHNKDVYFVVNPITVVKPFTDKFNPIANEITNLSDEYLLRIRLLVYEEHGNLIESKEEYLKNYTYNSSFQVNLEHGNYQALVITDVVTKEKRNYNWILSEESSIYSVKITSLVNFGKQRILGIGRVSFAISSDTDRIVINPHPAGALIYIGWNHIHGYKSIMKEFAIANNKASGCVTFDDNGYVASAKGDIDKYSWKSSIICPQEYDDYINYVADYSFELPIDDITFRYEEYYKDDLNLKPTYGYGETVNLKAGNIYYIKFDLRDPDNNDRSEFQISEW